MSGISEAEGIGCNVQINFQDVTWCDTLHRDISGCYVASYMT